MDAGPTGPTPPVHAGVRMPILLDELHNNLSPARSERYRLECLRNDTAEEHLKEQLVQMEKDYNLRRDRVQKQLEQNFQQWALINEKYRNLLHKELVAKEKLKMKEQAKAQQQAYAFTD
jgi:hypothetical protein